MQSVKRTISLEEFITYFLRKWKIVVAVVTIIAAMFAGATRLLGEEISVPHSEEYLYYEQESAWLESYLENSVLMKMNATEIPEITLYIENSAQPELLKDYILSKEVWTEFESERNKDYFYELLTLQEEETGKVALTIRHVTEEECLKTAKYLKEKLENYDTSIKVTAGELRYVKDENLQDEQLRWYDRIDYSKSLLLEAQAGYTIKVNMIAAVITGALIGGILSVVITLLMFVFQKSRKVL